MAKVELHAEPGTYQIEITTNATSTLNSAGLTGTLTASLDAGGTVWCDKDPDDDELQKEYIELRFYTGITKITLPTHTELELKHILLASASEFSSIVNAFSLGGLNYTLTVQLIELENGSHSLLVGVGGFSGAATNVGIVTAQTGVSVTGNNYFTGPQFLGVATFYLFAAPLRITDILNVTFTSMPNPVYALVRMNLGKGGKVESVGAGTVQSVTKVR